MGSRIDVLSMMRNQAPAYIHRLPVTTSFSCEAGRHIWGFPKDVMDIDFVDSGSTRTVTLRDEGKLVVQLSALSTASMSKRWAVGADQCRSRRSGCRAKV